MNVCEEHGGDCVVIYTGRDCPLCNEENDSSDKDATIADMTTEISSLKDEISDLQQQLAEEKTKE